MKCKTCFGEGFIVIQQVGTADCPECKPWLGQRKPVSRNPEDDRRRELFDWDNQCRWIIPKDPIYGFSQGVADCFIEKAAWDYAYSVYHSKKHETVGIRDPIFFLALVDAYVKGIIDARNTAPQTDMEAPAG